MAQKPAKSLAKGSTGVEGGLAGAQQQSSNADAASAAQQNNSRAATDPQNANDPLQAAASRDGPRQSIAGPMPPLSQCVEALEVNGEVPQARFGHTITIVSK